MAMTSETNYPFQYPQRLFAKQFLIYAGLPEISEARLVVIRTGPRRLLGNCGLKTMFVRDLAPKVANLTTPRFCKINFNRVPRWEEKLQ